MSRGRKSSYPEYPVKNSKNRSENGGGKRKTWLSDRSHFPHDRDQSPRLQFPWWRSPMYKEARLKKWSN